MSPFNSVAGYVKCDTAGQTGCNYWVKDTGIKYAFANSLYNSVIDIDSADSSIDGAYSDDVVYIPYTKASLDSNSTPCSPTSGNANCAYDKGGPYPVEWDKGGIIRMITNNDPDPANWFIKTLIDDIGPITSSVDILQDRTNKKLWVFFGEGRYFYTGDDLSTTRRLFGVSDPCYRNDFPNANKFYSTDIACPTLVLSDLADQNTVLNDLGTTYKGWYFNLRAQSGSTGAERLYGKISAQTNGVVIYPTFLPNTDPCVGGGYQSRWLVQFNSGGTVPKTGGNIKTPTPPGVIPPPVTTPPTTPGPSPLNPPPIYSGTPPSPSGLGSGDPVLGKHRPIKRFLNVQER